MYQNSGFKHIDLFSGIGGFALACRWNGIETVQFVEIDPFCQKVLNKNFPGVPIHDDIKTFKYDGDPPFILTGGFPCQPFSCAGKRRGKEDDRYLWPEMLRVVSEAKPRWVIGENVAGFINMGLDQCVSDLENQGYEVQAFVIPACAVGAPHRRDRVWICAHAVNGKHGTSRGQDGETDSLQGINRPSLCSRGLERTDSHATDTKESEREQSGGTRSRREGFTNGCESFTDTESKQTHTTEQRGLHAKPCGKDSDVTHTGNQGLQGSKWPGSHEQRQAAHGSIAERNNTWDEPWLEVAARLCRVDDGLPRRMDRANRLKALGNSIVPQVVAEIILAILNIETSSN